MSSKHGVRSIASLAIAGVFSLLLGACAPIPQHDEASCAPADRGLSYYLEEADQYLRRNRSSSIAQYPDRLVLREHPEFVIAVARDLQVLDSEYIFTFDCEGLKDVFLGTFRIYER